MGLSRQVPGSSTSTTSTVAGCAGPPLGRWYQEDTAHWLQGYIHLLKILSKALWGSVDASALLTWRSRGVPHGLSVCECACVTVCARVWEGTGGPRAGVQQSAGPVSVHCESVEGADFPSVSLVVGVGLQLRGGALVRTFTRWGRGGGSCSPSHNSTVTKTQHQSPQPCRVH